MTIDERLDRLAERHEALTVERLLTAAGRDGENIRALARIAEIHKRRPADLEGGE